MEKCDICKKKTVLFTVGKKNLCGDCSMDYLKNLQKRK